MKRFRSTGFRIRPARLPADAHLARDAAKSLLPYGNYERLIVLWMGSPTVRSYVAELRRASAGLCLLGFFEDPERRCQFADLLAIAVLKPFQRQGVGRALVRFAVAESRTVPGIAELRLSVAEGNLPARTLFANEGFTPRPYELGTYRDGQLALRLGLAL